MVYVLLGTGFEEVEAIAPVDLMRRAGIQVQTVGITGKTVAGSHKIPVEADILPENMDLESMDMIVLPGQAALDALRWGWEHDRFVAAICAGPTVLADLGIPDGKKATCFPGCEGQMGKADMIPGVAALRDGKLITGTSAGCAIPFALELIKALKGSEAADKVAKQIVIR